MGQWTRRTVMLGLALATVASSAGCGWLRAAAPVATRSFGAEAATARQAVHTAVQNLDSPAANRGLTNLRTIADDAATAARTEGTKEAEAAARQAAIAKRQAELEVATGWVDEVERYGRQKVKEELRKALRRAACDVAHEALDKLAQPDARQYAARVALYVHERLDSAATFEEVIGTVLDDLRLLLTLNPADAYDREVIVYLAETVFCPDSLPTLTPAQTGWGFNLLGESITVVNSDNQPVGSIGPNAMVRITCTSRGFEVQGPYGTSNLWDFVGNGFVPDSYLYTGTNEPVADPC
jgi:hypothetical protein